MELKYHRTSLELVKVTPIMGDTIRGNFPAAVTEWYSLVDGLDLLKKYSNQDEPLGPGEFKILQYQDIELSVFLYENQGVCWWAFENRNGDDPPVYKNTGPPLGPWIICCDKFSIFVYTRLFDFLHWYDEELVVLGVGDPITNEILEMLRNEYSEEPSTHSWPGQTQYRFSRNDQRILIQNDDQESNWYISADSSRAMHETFKEYSHLFHWHLPDANGG